MNTSRFPTRHRPPPGRLGRGLYEFDAQAGFFPRMPPPGVCSYPFLFLRIGDQYPEDFFFDVFFFLAPLPQIVTFRLFFVSHVLTGDKADSSL